MDTFGRFKHKAKVWKKAQKSRKHLESQLLKKSMLRLNKYFAVDEMKKLRKKLEQNVNCGKLFFWFDSIESFDCGIDANVERTDAIETLSNQFWELQSLVDANAKSYEDREAAERNDSLRSKCDSLAIENQRAETNRADLMRSDWFERSLVAEFDRGRAAIASTITECDLRTVYEANLKLLETMREP